jgi:hypothetical protein
LGPRQPIGTADNAPRLARGLLIVGTLSEKRELQIKAERLAGDDIRVETYKDLLHRARHVYGEIEQRLKSVAPEYSREARKKRLDKAPKKAAKATKTQVKTAAKKAKTR